jgi:hypothetical protein
VTARKLEIWNLASLFEGRILRLSHDTTRPENIREAADRLEVDRKAYIPPLATLVPNRPAWPSDPNLTHWNTEHRSRSSSKWAPVEMKTA